MAGGGGGSSFAPKPATTGMHIDGGGGDEDEDEDEDDEGGGGRDGGGGGGGGGGETEGARGGTSGSGSARLGKVPPALRTAIDEMPLSEEQHPLSQMSQDTLRRELEAGRQRERAARVALQASDAAAAQKKAQKVHTSRDLYHLDGSATGPQAMALAKASDERLKRKAEDERQKQVAKRAKAKEAVREDRVAAEAALAEVKGGADFDKLSNKKLKSLIKHLTDETPDNVKAKMLEVLHELAKVKAAIAEGVVTI